jgi:hypothetical protein
MLTDVLLDHCYPSALVVMPAEGERSDAVVAFTVNLASA